MIKSLSLAAAGLVVALFSAQAQAGLIGDEVACSSTLDGSFYVCDSASATVGAGSEFLIQTTGGGNRLSIDIGDSFIEFSNALSGFGLGTVSAIVTLSSLDWLGMPGVEIVDVLFSTSGTTGFDASDVSFDAHSVSFDIGGNWDSVGSFVRLDLVTRNVQAVPEPASFLALAAGLLALGGAGQLRRRRKGVAAA